MLGCDIRSLDAETLKLVTNKGLIAVNQDPEGRSAFKVDQGLLSDKQVIIARLLANGDIAVGFFNMSDQVSNRLVLNFEVLGLPAHAGFNLSFTDLLNPEKAPIERRECFTCDGIAPHDCAMYRAKFVRRV